MGSRLIKVHILIKVPNNPYFVLFLVSLNYVGVIVLQTCTNVGQTTFICLCTSSEGELKQKRERDTSRKAQLCTYEQSSAFPLCEPASMSDD